MFKVGDYVEVCGVDSESWKHLIGTRAIIAEIDPNKTHPYRLNQCSWFKQQQLKYVSPDESKSNFVKATKETIEKQRKEMLEKAIDSAHVSKGGSLRYNKGKPEFSHLSPEFILEMMKTMTKSNEKYPYLNYTKKQDVKTASDSLMRHYLEFQLGNDLDDDTNCHHLAHLAVNAMIIFQNLKDYGEEVDNRYTKAKERVQNEV